MKAFVSLISLLLGAGVFCFAITTHGMGMVSALGMLLIAFALLFPFVTGGAATPAPAPPGPFRVPANTPALRRPPPVQWLNKVSALVARSTRVDTVLPPEYLTGTPYRQGKQVVNEV